MFYVLLCYDQTLGVCRHSHVIGPLTPPHAPSAHRQLPSCRSQAVDVLCKSHALHTRAPESSDALWPAISIGNPRLPRGCLPGPVPGRSSLWPAGLRESGLHGEYGIELPASHPGPRMERAPRQGHGRTGSAPQHAGFFCISSRALDLLSSVIALGIPRRS